MNKRRLHHALHQLRKVRILYFVALILISATVSGLALRQNSIRSVQLQENVVQADKNNGDVEGALRELRQHVYGHMNTGLSSPGKVYPPIQLKYRYDRLVEAERARVTAANSQLYTQAQASCEQTIPSGRTIGRVECIQNYVTSHGAVAERPINDDLYKFDFVAPLWSPDLAGWSVLLTLVLLLALAVRLSVATWLRYSLRSHM